ncbi:preprotein translocase subunit SecE [Corynebacterium choanae]|uniref:Protein translocase subunit SecE n=1 Tax=Corynebacterium choanae TaxID=1862358 RepID=A0A3G6JCR6_9CORY|nr:preprotein translocase subunit SecE [Corynebacterium choanae]AZA14450.1 preprotein translocase subunit SecE [Corynebacterium choanae]
MSDEHNPELVGAARPAGKRQVSGVSTTSSEVYAAKNAVPAANAAEEEKEKSLGKRVVDYVPETVQELKKVIWPTGKQMVVYTSIVFAFLIVLTALVWGVDTLTGIGVEKVLTPR